MANHENQISRKAGLPPGTLLHIGKRKSKKQRITVFDFDESEVQDFQCKKVEDCFPFKNRKSVSWINIDGLHNTDNISKIGEHFNIHPLVLEDILNTKIRPQIEEYDDYVFISLKMLGLSENQDRINSEQLSFILGENYVLTFQEKRGDIFDGLRNRIKEGKGVIRKRGNDYLLYRLIDTVVDHYYFIIENYSERIEKLEEKVLEEEGDEFVFDVQSMKRRVTSLRRQILPLREILTVLKKDENEVLQESTRLFVSDVYDHILHILDSIDSQKEALTSMLELHTSLLGHKMNQIMKVLTIMASIFIPLTFVAGIYGMNFEHMPELGWKYGYFGVWGLMLLIFIGMLFYFRRKKWL
jgi:magnesium transporter